MIHPLTDLSHWRRAGARLAVADRRRGTDPIALDLRDESDEMREVLSYLGLGDDPTEDAGTLRAAQESACAGYRTVMQRETL